MKQKKTILLAVIALALLATAAALYFGQQGRDRIEISQGDGSFSLRFEAKRLSQAQPMELSEGDTLRVSWTIDGGNVDVRIGTQDAEPIYRADGRGRGDTAAFDLLIPAAGRYVISVTGQNAKGAMEFARQ